MSAHMPLRIPVLVAVAVLAGCSALNPFNWFGPAKAKTDAIAVVAEMDANRNTATALDIVFVYDATAGALLPKLGPEWFVRKRELTNGMAGKLDVVSLQIPPAMVIDSVALPKRHGDALGVVVFANYLAKDGQYPGNLTPYKRAVIRLKPETIEYASAE